MKASKHFVEKGEELMKQADMAQESCDWWIKEVENSLQKLEEWENSSSPRKSEGEEILKHLEYLLSKSELEQRNLDEIESKVQKYLFYKEIINNKK
jgi:hypothetical protein